MSDATDPNLDTDEGAEDSGLVRDLRQKLEKAQERAKQADVLQTENALLSAGLGTLSERQRKALLAAHEGDLSGDTLKATATELGFIAQAEPEPQVNADEQAAHERMQRATSAAEPSSATQRTYLDEMRDAKTLDERKAILAREGLLVQE